MTTDVHEKEKERRQEGRDGKGLHLLTVIYAMAKSMKLGGGGRFQKLKTKLAKKPGVTDPGALAAAIGRKKYGAKKFGRLAARGK